MTEQQQAVIMQFIEHPNFRGLECVCTEKDDGRQNHEWIASWFSEAAFASHRYTSSEGLAAYEACKEALLELGERASKDVKGTS